MMQMLDCELIQKGNYGLLNVCKIRPVFTDSVIYTCPCFIMSFCVLCSVIGFLSSLYLAGVITVKYFIIDDEYLTCSNDISTTRYNNIDPMFR